MSPPLQRVAAVRIDGTVREAMQDVVAEETPVALVYNGVSHAVMMATPADLEDFALGFSLSEGIVEQPSEFDLVEIRATDDGVSIQMAIASPRFEALQARGRHLVGRVGCGLCGADSLAAAIRPLRPLAPAAPVAAEAIRAGVDALAAAQPLNERSHGLHAAGCVHAGGIVVREDIGRHNALDKVIGAVARAELRAGFLVITSRASYEVVHKAASAGIALVAAISAPTALAIRLADAAGVTLAAFARGRRMTLYTHPEAVLGAAGRD